MKVKSIALTFARPKGDVKNRGRSLRFNLCQGELENVDVLKIMFGSVVTLIE